MLIRLKEDWSLYKAGQVVDVYSSIGGQLIRDGIGIDSEKTEPVMPKLEIREEVVEEIQKEKQHESFTTKTILPKDKSKISKEFLE